MTRTSQSKSIWPKSILTCFPAVIAAKGLLPRFVPRRRLCSEAKVWHQEKKGQQGPAKLQGIFFLFHKSKFQVFSNAISGSTFTLVIPWAIGLPLGQAFSFVDLVGCDSVTETEAHQVDLIGLRLRMTSFYACWFLVEFNILGNQICNRSTTHLIFVVH